MCCFSSANVRSTIRGSPVFYVIYIYIISPSCTAVFHGLKAFCSLFAGDAVGSMQSARPASEAVRASPSCWKTQTNTHTSRRLSANRSRRTQNLVHTVPQVCVHICAVMMVYCAHDMKCLQGHMIGFSRLWSDVWLWDSNPVTCLVFVPDLT